MALGPDRKLEIAWEFMHRNKAYLALWDRFSKDQRKLLKGMPRQSMRTRLRGCVGVVERLKIQFRRQFQAQFGIADFCDPFQPNIKQNLSERRIPRGCRLKALFVRGSKCITLNGSNQTIQPKPSI